MSDTVEILIMSLAMIGAITAALVWYATAYGKREGRETRGDAITGNRFVVHLDPDAHLGRSGSE